MPLIKYHNHAPTCEQLAFIRKKQLIVDKFVRLEFVQRSLDKSNTFLRGAHYFPNLRAF